MHVLLLEERAQSDPAISAIVAEFRRAQLDPTQKSTVQLDPGGGTKARM